MEPSYPDPFRSSKCLQKVLQCKRKIDMDMYIEVPSLLTAVSWEVKGCQNLAPALTYRGHNFPDGKLQPFLFSLLLLLSLLHPLYHLLYSI